MGKDRDNNVRQTKMNPRLGRSHNVDMINGGVLIPLILYSVPIF